MRDPSTTPRGAARSSREAAGSTTASPGRGHAAIVLTGGRAERLGGVSKAALVVGGRTLLDRVVSAVPDASPLVVVGADGHPDAIGVVEDPPGSGPAFATRAGLDRVPDDVPFTVVLAVDLPFVTRATIDRLLDAAEAADGAILHDADGRPQWLCGAWRTDRLKRRADGVRAGASMRSLLDGMDTAIVTADAATPAWLDCDTPEALAAARRLDAG